jgi:hypothetical protein
MPGFGNEMVPSPSAPKSFTTHRNGSPPLALMVATKRPTASGGITHWYWVRPRGP